MSSTAGIGYVLQAVAAGCMAAAYLVAGRWFVLPLLAVLAIGWILIRRRSAGAAARWLLAGATGLAAIAAVMDLPMTPIALGMVAALAAWDLNDFEAALQSSARAVDRVRLSSLHVKWLAPALGSGLVLALFASSVTLDLPFAAAAVLAVLMVVSLTRAAQQLLRARGS